MSSLEGDQPIQENKNKKQEINKQNRKMTLGGKMRGMQKKQYVLNSTQGLVRD